jgi:hypothetical protein
LSKDSTSEDNRSIKAMLLFYKEKHNAVAELIILKERLPKNFLSPWLVKTVKGFYIQLEKTINYLGWCKILDQRVGHILNTTIKHLLPGILLTRRSKVGQTPLSK